MLTADAWADTQYDALDNTGCDWNRSNLTSAIEDRSKQVVITTGKRYHTSSQGYSWTDQAHVLDDPPKPGKQVHEHPGSVLSRRKGSGLLIDHDRYSHFFHAVDWNEPALEVTLMSVRNAPHLAPPEVKY